MKKILFGILAVVLSIGAVRADDIKDLTLDTPVNWPVSAFNKAVGQNCEGLWNYEPSDVEIGSFNARTQGFYDYTDKTVVDIEKNCGQFVLQYGALYRRDSRISLRTILDVCMKTINDSGRCARLAQGLVYYSMGHDGIGSVESDINEFMKTSKERMYDDNGLFYVNIKTTYTNGKHELVDENMYLKNNNMIVGKCQNKVHGDDNSFDCEMVSPDYASWSCSLDLTYGWLMCFDYYVSKQEHRIEDLKRNINCLNSMFINGSESVKDCVIKMKQKLIEQNEQDLTHFGPVQTEYSYTRWKEASIPVESAYDLIKDTCHPSEIGCLFR